MVKILIYALEVCFALGLIGSLLVLVLTTFEDVKELFGGESKHADRNSQTKDRTS